MLTNQFNIRLFDDQYWKTHMNDKYIYSAA